MNFKEALQVLMEGGPNSYAAVQVIEEAVLLESTYGDPDHSLQDWIANGNYDGDETPASIAAEWDACGDENCGDDNNVL